MAQATPSDGGLFAEIFAALAQTPQNTDTPLTPNMPEKEPQAPPPWGQPFQAAAALSGGVVFDTAAPRSSDNTQLAAADAAPAASAAPSEQLSPLSGGAGFQPATPPFLGAYGPDPVPQQENAASNPVAPQPADPSQPTTPPPSPGSPTLTPQTQTQPQTQPQPLRIAAPAPKPSIQTAQPVKPSKKEAAHPAQNPQLPNIPLIPPAAQTPEPVTQQPAPTQSTTSFTAVQPWSNTTADQSTPAAPPLHNTPPASSPGNLSFAMRIGLDAQNTSDPKPQTTPQQQANTQTTPAAPQSQSSDPITSAAALPDHPQQEQPDDKPAPEHAAKTPESLLVTPTESASPGPTAEARPAHSSQPAPATSAPEVEPKPAASTNEPVRNMHIQLSGDNNQRVNVHLMDRGGELRVSVKSPDLNLSQTLQEHIPELTSRLEQQHYRTEVWMPKETASPGSSNNSNNNTNSNGSSNNPGYGNPGGRQNGQQQQDRPEWLDDLEDNPRRPQTTRRN